jgi:hypothetical protein
VMEMWHGHRPRAPGGGDRCKAEGRRQPDIMCHVLVNNYYVNYVLAGQAEKRSGPPRGPRRPGPGGLTLLLSSKGQGARGSWGTGNCLKPEVTEV